MNADALRHWITGAAYQYADGEVWPEWRHHSLMMWVWRLALLLRICSRINCRIRGHVWPRLAVTMIGEARAVNIIDVVKMLNREHVPGALVDCGVWRGGSTILMTQAHFDSCLDHSIAARIERHIYCCDTFDGFPETQALIEDVACPDALRIPVGEVMANFDKFGVSRDCVRFVQGDVCETLHNINEPIALLRIDVDMHKPTLACLEILYPKLSKGCVVIIDDYGSTAFDCKRAVDEFRNKHGVTAPMVQIDSDGVYWVRGIQSRTRP